MIESAETQDQRIERLQRWCVTGQAAAAELELTSWRRETHCPAGAKVLLASLRARRGELRDAREALGDVRQLDASALTPDLARMLIAVDTLLKDEAEASYATRVLHHQHGHEPSVSRWLAVSDAPGVSELPDTMHAKATQLAEELALRFDLIPTLVFAQKTRPATARMSLLRSALLRLVGPNANNAGRQLTLCRALAQLAQLAGDEDEARRWAHRGLELDPYCVTLAMILSWVPDDAHTGQPAADVLARVHAEHPNYPDIAEALERRRDDERAQEFRRAA
ncbi:MAG: hypothetical protein AAGF84_04545 [Planctomycetota bacterium]